MSPDWTPLAYLGTVDNNLLQLPEGSLLRIGEMGSVRKAHQR